MDRDYIIAFDENGEPYIAHALGSRLSGAVSNARRAGSRYLMKIQTKYGNRYFYTPQEVQAYQRAKSGVKKASNSAKSAVNNTKKQVNQAVKTLKSDLKKRRTWKNAEKEAASPLKDVKQIDKGWYQGRIETAAESAYDKKYAEATKKTYDKTKLGKAENAAKSATDRMKEEFRKKKEDVKDKLGYDERERRDLAQKRAETVGKVANKEAESGTHKISESIWEKDEKKSKELFDKGLKQRDDAWAAAKRSREAAWDAQKEYNKTPLGKVDKAKDALRSVKDDIDVALYDAEKKIKKAGGNVKDAADDAAFEIEYAAKRAVNNVTGNKDKATRDWYLRSIEALKEEAKSKPGLEEFYDRVIEKAQKEADKYDERYQSTLGGKVENAIDKIKDRK